MACLHAACRTTADILVNAESSASTRKRREGDKDGNTQARRSQTGGGRLIASSGGSGRSAAGGKRGARGIAVESNAVAGGGDGSVDAIVLSPDLVADTALASLNIHSGIVLLEDGIMRKISAKQAVSAVGKEASSGGRGSRGGGGSGRSVETQSRGQSNVGEGHQDSWLHLSRLYAALGERDALVGVAARASRLEGTR